MCGRFVQISTAERLALTFEAIDVTDRPIGPRHNVAPSTPIRAIIDAGGRRLGTLNWGFIPDWARDPDTGPRPINARVEGAATSRLFSPALERRRCIVPVDAWYEWTDEGGARQPWLLRPTSEAPVAVAALWSVWHDRRGGDAARRVSTVALMTTEAKGEAAEVHDRMPLLVPFDLLDEWLDREAPVGDGLLQRLRSGTIDVRVLRVSKRVNDVRNDDPELLEPVDAS